MSLFRLVSRLVTMPDMRGYLKVPLYPSACLSVFRLVSRLVSRLVRMPDMRGYLEVPLYQSADLFWACETCLLVACSYTCERFTG